MRQVLTDVGTIEEGHEVEECEPRYDLEVQVANQFLVLRRIRQHALNRGRGLDTYDQRLFFVAFPNVRVREPVEIGRSLRMVCMLSIQLLLVVEAMMPAVAIALLHVINELESGKAVETALWQVNRKEATWASTRNQSLENRLPCIIAFISLSEIDVSLPSLSSLTPR